jgi:hypothetical protein
LPTAEKKRFSQRVDRPVVITIPSVGARVEGLDVDGAAKLLALLR